MRRVESPGRGGEMNGKMNDGNALREMRARGYCAFEFGDDDELVIDISSLSAVDAAAKIFAWFEARQSEPRACYYGL